MLGEPLNLAALNHNTNHMEWKEKKDMFCLLYKDNLKTYL